MKLSADESALLVIDIQDKLLAKIPEQDSLVRNSAFLMDTAKLVNVPVLVTEQYPKGLGPTTPILRQRFSADTISKTAFSCCGAASFLDQLRRYHRYSVVLAGMEMHVCVMQTAFDLLAAGFTVYLPVDALASRFRIDYDTALRRLEREGCRLATTESIGFEWIGDAVHPRFKDFSQLVMERTR